MIVHLLSGYGLIGALSYVVLYAFDREIRRSGIPAHMIMLALSIVLWPLCVGAVFHGAYDEARRVYRRKTYRRR